MGVSLAMALSIAKNKALEYGGIGIINVQVGDDGNSLVFTMSDGMKHEVPIDNITKDTSKVFIGETEPNIKAKDNDLYIDKINKKIYSYYNYKWNFVCEIGLSDTLVQDIENLKINTDKLQKKVSKLNVGVRII